VTAPARRAISAFSTETELLLADYDVPPERWGDLRALVSPPADDPDMIYVHAIPPEKLDAAERLLGVTLPRDGVEYFAEAFSERMAAAIPGEHSHRPTES